MVEVKKNGLEWRGDKDDKLFWFSVSVLIPVTGQKTTNETIESVIRQECPNCEILILRNDTQDLLQGTDVAEEDVFYQNYLLREIFIRKKGKGNALNEGIRLARNDWFTILSTLP